MVWLIIFKETGIPVLVKERISTQSGSQEILLGNAVLHPVKTTVNNDPSSAHSYLQCMFDNLAKSPWTNFLSTCNVFGHCVPLIFFFFFSFYLRTPKRWLLLKQGTLFWKTFFGTFFSPFSMNLGSYLSTEFIQSSLFARTFLQSISCPSFCFILNKSTDLIKTTTKTLF